MVGKERKKGRTKKERERARGEVVSYNSENVVAPAPSFISG